MSLMVRQATPQDLPEILRLCEQKVYLDSLLIEGSKLRQLARDFLRDNFSKLEETPHCRLLVAYRADQQAELIGYAVLVLHTQETITQELQTVIFNFVAPSFEVLSALVGEAVNIVGQAQDDYLVVHLMDAAKKEQIWFYRLGFRPELNRVVKPIAAGHVGAASPNYRTRTATANDHLFIIRVNAEYSAAYRPAGRDTDLQDVQATFLYSYGSLNLQDPKWRYTILMDRKTDMPAGYIILSLHPLPLSSQIAYYTYDVAVAPEFAGRGLSLYLCGAAETIVGAEGGGFIYGDTSLDNLAAVNGDRQLGFIVDSKRWGLDCRGFVNRIDKM